MSEPLVSIAVITYNSARYVQETLDSVFAQTYGYLELIISDDGSTDGTIDLCEKWLQGHTERFVDIKIICSPSNTGTSANYNRAENACGGEWVLCLDGDDILASDCISEYIQYVSKNQEASVVFSRVKCFGDFESGLKQMSDFFNYDFFNWSIEQQLNYLSTERNCIPSGTFFFNLKKYRELGMKNDERIPLLEDWPKWINLLRKGVQFYFIDKVLVNYRMSESSLCTGELYKKNYMKSYAAVFVYYQYKAFAKKHGKRLAIEKYLNSRVTMGKNTLLWRCLRKFYCLFQ